MVRKDREVTDLNEIIGIVSRCDSCTVGLNGDDGYPYLLPLNFGFKVEGERLTLYFHSALKGRKHELMAKDNRATFSMNCGHDLFYVEERGYCTMNYESVIGHGKMEYVTDDAEKMEALTLLTDRFHAGHFAFNPAAMSRTSVYKLVVSVMTAKRKSTENKKSSE